MTKIFETISNVKYASKKRPKSLLTPIPPAIRDYLEITSESTLRWMAMKNENGDKYIKIIKVEEQE